MMVVLCVVDNCKKKLTFEIVRNFKLDKLLMKNIAEVNGIKTSIYEYEMKVYLFIFLNATRNVCDGLFYEHTPPPPGTIVKNIQECSSNCLIIECHSINSIP